MEDFQYLLERGYKSQPSIDFTGNHYLLSSRQRIAIQRSVATEAQYEKRKTLMLPLESAKDGCIIVDGFNLIITLEVALSKSILILGRDGVIRTKGKFIHRIRPNTSIKHKVYGIYCIHMLIMLIFICLYYILIYKRFYKKRGGNTNEEMENFPHHVIFYFVNF